MRGRFDGVGRRTCALFRFKVLEPGPASRVATILDDRAGNDIEHLLDFGPPRTTGGPVNAHMLMVPRQAQCDALQTAGLCA